MENIFNIQNHFFKGGTTNTYEFRIEQLKKLKKVLTSNEKDILLALSIDLKKPEYEAYTSEIGLVYKELNEAIKNLKYWIREESIPTPIYLKPASSYRKPVPKGVVLIISPWNYPFLLTFSPLIGAIAAGNCIVIKPSNKSAISSRLIKNIIDESFPDKYISVVEGAGSSVVEPLIRNSSFNHIFFTGSRKVGKNIARLAAESLTPVTLELGGKSPAIVDETIDLKLAAKKITWAKYLNTGQTCIAPDYVLIPKYIKSEFIGLLQEYINKFYGKDIINNPDYGRIINEERFNRLLYLLEDLDVVYGGSHRRDQLYIEPTIVEASMESNIMKEEIFGPILPIITYEDGYELFSIIDQNPNPLALYLFSQDENFHYSIINNIQFGGGCINDTMSHMVNMNLPFGGIGESGMGSYHSYYSFKEFSHFKSMVESSSNMDLNLKYPPYTKGKLMMGRLFLR